MDKEIEIGDVITIDKRIGKARPYKKKPWWAFWKKQDIFMGVYHGDGQVFIGSFTCIKIDCENFIERSKNERNKGKENKTRNKRNAG